MKRAALILEKDVANLVIVLLNMSVSLKSPVEHVLKVNIRRNRE